MPPSNVEPVIIRSPSGRPLTVAFVGCGGTGRNILAEGLLPDGSARVAVGSDRLAMASLKTGKLMVASARELESNAMISSKSVRLAGSEFEKELASSLVGADITFIIAGLGGLSGGWGAVVGARAAAVSRSIGFCVASVPFSAEGGSRRERAATQLKALIQVADASLVIPNDMILSEAPNLPINSALRVMNSVLASPVNLFLRSFGSDDLDMLEKHLALGKIMAMDSAEWDRDNAEFAVIEALGKSRWLELGTRKPKSAILFIEGGGVHGDMAEILRLFLRLAGKDCPVIAANAGERKQGLRVTAVVGF